MAATTFYWHDYETFGTDPSRDRAVQFAGIRTDAELNIISKPLEVFARPANDFLPHPAACLVTGITPQMALEKGVPECEFIEKIHAELALPGTCGVGYNSLRFDDEFTRYTLYRNFYDPYAREWQNGNSRWDIIDMVRTTCALRPDGINWPLRDDGLPSFRLEDLTKANGISHEGAHDAMSDVYATIAVARLIKTRQPRLYAYIQENRDKHSILRQLDIPAMKPVLHVSGMFGAQRHNIALIVPLAAHPSNRNEIICHDLSAPPERLFDLEPQALSELLYMPSDSLPDGVERLGLKSVHINKCPVLLTAKMADPATAERLGIDGAVCRRHLAALREFAAKDQKRFTKKVQAIYSQREFEPVTDPDRMLYGGGFFAENDKRTMDQLRKVPAQELGESSFAFEDKRLAEMLFRYRARNYPDTLSDEELALWEEYRFARLTEPEAGASLCMEEFQEDIESRLQSGSATQQEIHLLEQLLEYADTLLS